MRALFGFVPPLSLWRLFSRGGAPASTGFLDPPDNVLGGEDRETLTRYVWIKLSIEDRLRRHEKVRLLYVMKLGLDGIEAGAMWRR